MEKPQKKKPQKKGEMSRSLKKRLTLAERGRNGRF